MKKTSDDRKLTENAVVFPCYIDVRAIWYGRKPTRPKTVSEDLAEKVLNKNTRNLLCGK